jgi:hypothetical protein
MKTFLRIPLLLVGLSTIIISCKQDEIGTYSVNDSSLYFGSSLSSFSFFDTPDSTSMIASIPVTLMGPSTPYDRTFDVVVDTAYTTAPTNQYQILGGIVKADSLFGTLYVKLCNSDTLSKISYKLGVKVVPNKDFQIGLPSKDSTLIKWDASLPVPEWFYKRSFGKYVSYITVNGAKKYSVYSEQLYRIMIQVWGTRYINAYGLYSPNDMVYPGNANFSVLIRQLEKYVYDYNQAHPNAPLRHSSDAAVYTTTGAISATYPNLPLIQINPYNQ